MTDKKPTLIVIDKADLNSELGIKTLIPESTLCIACPTADAAALLKRDLFAKKIMGGKAGFNGQPDQFEANGLVFLAVKGMIPVSDPGRGEVSRKAEILLGKDYRIQKVASIEAAKEALTGLVFENMGMVQNPHGRTPS